jgi:hypothetical protein
MYKLATAVCGYGFMNTEIMEFLKMLSGIHNLRIKEEAL